MNKFDIGDTVKIVSSEGWKETKKYLGVKRFVEERYEIILEESDCNFSRVVATVGNGISINSNDFVHSSMLLLEKAR